MTDFVDDLERELLDAARRRSPAPSPVPAAALPARPRPGHRRRGGPRRPRHRPTGRQPGAPRPVAAATGPSSPRRRPGSQVLVLNETGIDGLASVTRDELYVRFRLDIAVDVGRETSRKRTVVQSGRAAEALGHKVADALHAPFEIDERLRTFEGRRPQVLVLLGSDRMR